MDDLARSKFESLLQLSEYKIENFPLFLNSDGFLLIVKDRSNLLREPSALERQFYCKPMNKNQGKISLSSLNSTSTIDSNGERNSRPKIRHDKYSKEKGIVITVKEVNPFDKADTDESPKSTESEIKVVEHLDLDSNKANTMSNKSHKEEPATSKNSSLRDFKMRQMKANRNKNFDIEIYTPNS